MRGWLRHIRRFGLLHEFTLVDSNRNRVSERVAEQDMTLRSDHHASLTIGDAVCVAGGVDRHRDVLARRSAQEPVVQMVRNRLHNPRQFEA